MLPPSVEVFRLFSVSAAVPSPYPASERTVQGSSCNLWLVDEVTGRAVPTCATQVFRTGVLPFSLFFAPTLCVRATITEAEWCPAVYRASNFPPVRMRGRDHPGDAIEGSCPLEVVLPKAATEGTPLAIAGPDGTPTIPLPDAVPAMKDADEFEGVPVASASPWGRDAVKDIMDYAAPSTEGSVEDLFLVFPFSLALLHFFQFGASVPSYAVNRARPVPVASPGSDEGPPSDECTKFSVEVEVTTTTVPMNVSWVHPTVFTPARDGGVRATHVIRAIPPIVVPC